MGYTLNEVRNHTLSPSTTSAVAKWGNSTGVRIPKQVLKDAQIEEGNEVLVEAEGPGIIRMRLAQSPVTLEELVSRITPANRHRELFWGSPQGKEVW